MRAMKKVNNVHVEIRNNDYPRLADMVKELNLDDKVDVKPLVSSSEFEALQYRFDALILFGNKTPYQIPGKVFTYISTGKTVVYIKNNDFEDDGTEQVLKKYGNVIIVKNDKNEIEKSINEFMSKNQFEKEYNSEQFMYQRTMEPLVEMAKKVSKVVKLQVPGGKATPAPPVGPALGQAGVNIMAFVKDFNARTVQQVGLVIPVVITVYEDRSFTFICKTPPAAVLLKKAAGLEKASGEPNKNKVATLSRDKAREIAQMKMADLNASDLEAATRMVEGTARSMGIVISD